MDPRHPPVPSPATHAQSHASGHTSPADTDCDCDSEFNEKDAHVSHASRLKNGRAHDSVISPFSPKPSAPCSPSSSPSSSFSSDAGRKHTSLTEIHAADADHTNRVSYPPRAHLGDPEKAASYDAYEQHSQHSQHSQLRASAPDAIVYDKSEYHDQGPEDKAWQLLFFLSGPCALLSIAITLWTLLATLIALTLYPLRFCTSRPALSTQLTTFLAPPLNLQLHLVYSFDASESYSVPMLLVIHLFSPIVAFGVAVASWTAAGFWFFSSILGDPGGHDGGRHNDGKDSILGVRGYWERWLLRGLR